jgi:hypothetical protein
MEEEHSGHPCHHGLPSERCIFSQQARWRAQGKLIFSLENGVQDCPIEPAAVKMFLTGHQVIGSADTDVPWARVML